MYCPRAGLLEVAALRGPVTQAPRLACCLIHAENHRVPVALALPVSGHSHSAVAQAKAVPAAAETDYLWVTEDKVVLDVEDEEVVLVVAEEAVLAEEVVAAGVDTRLQSGSTGTHSNNSR